MLDLAVLGGGEDGAAAVVLARRAGAAAAQFARASVWGLGGGVLVPPGAAAGPFRLDTIGPEGNRSVDARALIVCDEISARRLAFPGWTLPGVIGLAAAACGLSPGGSAAVPRVVMATALPRLRERLAAMRASGALLVAVIDRTRPRDWGGDAAATWRQRARLREAGVTVLTGHLVGQAVGSSRLEAVEAVPARGGDGVRIACDVLVVDDGDAQATEAMRLLGARHHYRRDRGGFVPVLGPWQRSSVPRLYAGGTTQAEAEVAACAALVDLGLMPQWRASRRVQAEGARLRAARRRAQRAARLGAPPRDAVAALPLSCIVCPCEGLDRAAIEAALDEGARDVNQLKQFTRCGMGPCRGSLCAETAAELVALRVGGRDAAGIWTARAPLIPLPLGALLGEFDYADIPVPPPAPL